MTLTVKNPWHDLPTDPPFVLPIDHAPVREFNEKAQLDKRLDLDLIPQPFLGNRDAPLLILGANPNVRGGHAGGPVAAAIRANLSPDPNGHSLIGLLPEFADTPNAEWWRQGCLPEVLGLGPAPQELADRILSIELHGYHSKAWRRPSTPFPSQRYGFWLVEQAMARGAVIVVLACRGHWETAVPGLSTYRHFVAKQNRRSRSYRISQGNLGHEGFREVLRALA